MNNKRHITFLAGFFLLGFSVFAQKDLTLFRENVNEIFRNLKTPFALPPNESCKVERVRIDKSDNTIYIYGNEIFSSLPFTDQSVTSIYNEVKKELPRNYRKYKLIILGKNYPIENFIPNATTRKKQREKKWSKKQSGNAWVSQNSIHEISQGLAGRHFSVWASHGRVYRQPKDAWKWQRPNLFCTNEDLLTQTIVIPYLIPMLENAGAYVFSPRERNWQKNEVIIDNDRPLETGRMEIINRKHPWNTGAARGFSYSLTQPLLEGCNPFEQGTAMQVKSVSKTSQASSAIWTPDIPEEGHYAVYISYPNDTRQISDAQYTVVHQGMETHFKVNQKMGGGTWVHLGTFFFEKGQSARNRVYLSNLSEENGLVGADAVRFGGGMGHVVRGSLLEKSGLPRFLEGARYYAQWAGMPYDVYSSKEGSNDYADDINARSRMSNYLAGGSEYLPSDRGLRVPLEATIAIHSDAGVRRDNSIIGTLGIYTTQTNDGVFPEGMSRLASRDMCDLILSQIHSDMRNMFGKWNRRQMFDRNYSETREPQIPAVIIETLSHQNYADMRLAHDPTFKFHLARAIYKGILRYTAEQHNLEYTIAPLPVSSFRTSIDLNKKNIRLEWAPSADLLEPSAKPTGYIVYTQKGNMGFDNGVFTKNTHLTIKAEPNIQYNFKVCAVNEGGLSMPSEQLTAYISGETRATILLINGFQRLAGPQPVETDEKLGFDLNLDPGIYWNSFPGYCGAQINFDRSKMGLEGAEGLGYSGEELSGMLIAGNTFDYPTLHGRDIAHAGIYSFASCSREAVEEGEVNLNDYNAVDLILGLQRMDGYSLRNYKTFSIPMQNALKEYLRMQGNLFVSGAFVGSDMLGVNEQQFTQNYLKFSTSGRVQASLIHGVQGMNTSCTLFNRLNETRYAATWVDCITPTMDAFSVMLYNNQVSAGTAYAGKDYHCLVLGFPFESIKEDHIRTKMMAAILNFLLSK